jgi:hypothetical protein
MHIHFSEEKCEILEDLALCLKKKILNQNQLDNDPPVRMTREYCESEPSSIQTFIKQT